MLVAIQNLNTNIRLFSTLNTLTCVSREGNIGISCSSFYTESSTAGRNLNPEVLTVWKKSLLFSCDGFTVFDANGNLVFRVDNYAARNKSEIVLMDASGRSLLTIRRKRLSLTDSWLVYNGETTVNPRFSVTKNVNFQNAKSPAYVSTTGSPNNGNKKNLAYEIKGSYSQRCCVMYDGKRRRIAELKRKEAVRGVAFGGDVFRLIPRRDGSRCDSRSDVWWFLQKVIFLNSINQIANLRSGWVHKLHLDHDMLKCDS